MYEQFLANPSTVDPSWHDFFADRPAPLSGNGQVPRASTQAPPKQPPATRARGQAVVRTHAQHAALEQDTTTPLRGAAARVVANMETSLELPTATSVRAIPAKLLVDNRIVINNHLNRTHGGKVSFTHLIGYAVVRALADIPQMNRHYTTDNQGKPAVVAPEHVNLGLAIDLKSDKGRSLLVASIKGCEVMTFTQFWQAYEDIIRKARGGKLTAEDLAASTISLTNPGTIGTNHSVPRLMSGQGAIIGVGAMEFPAAFQGASDQALAKMAISKIITLTSTYDHRIIQGAESG
ncbi:MAG TPA: 2-oxo acid dehydrogenase subunit E2, partial [Pseudonocardiaceae bacterium]|nr:2-oxo acid dehydrogenase subunit E2 [Pseudonocardiaceae bacterium]